MCGGLGQPATVVEALGMLDRALDHLNAADAASLPSGVQAEALRALERAGAKHTAARARMLAAFAGQAAYEDGGQGSARAWLKWQTRVTTGAAAGAVGWARRLAAHPVIGEALAAGELSESWARQVCAWTNRLPEAQQGAADEILTAAARGGVDLAGLAGLAREMYERTQRDRDGDVPDGFGERAVWLDTTLGGAGRLTGDLTAGCSAALSAVLAALGKRAGPEDIRSAAQRRHDALEEACRRLVAAGMLPGRAGQSTQIQVHMTLAQLRGLAGASATEAAWAAARASQPGWVTGPEAEAAACDASVVPIVTGHLDWTALDRLTEVFLTARARWPATPGSAGHVSSGAGEAPGAAGHVSSGAGEAHGVSKAAGQPDSPGSAAGQPGRPGSAPGQPDRPGSAAGQPGRPGSAAGQPGRPGSAAGQPGRPGSAAGQPGRPGSAPAAPSGGTGEAGGVPGLAGSADGPFSPKTRQRLRRALLALAADTLAGPGGLAAQLRAGLDGPLASVSLPLDVGPATETIPAHLRRAATTRHPHCAFPGCAQPASVCDIHHIIPRSRGGPTSLDNLLTMCTFHHKIVIHRWGWSVRLNSDGTTTATSPDGRTLHSHGPPSRAA